MPSNKDDRSRLEQGRRDTQIRHDTAVHGSMGTPPSGDAEKVTPQSDMFKDEESKRPGEDMRGSASPESRPQRKPGRLPLPD
jgi:hypothetical protein